jgi:hypothetical protein
MAATAAVPPAQLKALVDSLNRQAKSQPRKVYVFGTDTSKPPTVTDASKMPQLLSAAGVMTETKSESKGDFKTTPTMMSMSSSKIALSAPPVPTVPKIMQPPSSGLGLGGQLSSSSSFSAPPSMQIIQQQPPAPVEASASAPAIIQQQQIQAAAPATVKPSSSGSSGGNSLNESNVDKLTSVLNNLLQTVDELRAETVQCRQDLADHRQEFAELREQLVVAFQPEQASVASISASAAS